MEDKTYSIKLANGVIIADVEHNGSAFISKDPDITFAVFKNNTSSVTIIDPEGKKETLSNVEVVESAGFEDAFAFSFVPLTAEEIRLRQIEANQEYIAMMSDIDL